MQARTLPRLLVAVALALFIGAAAFAQAPDQQEQTHEGKIVKAGEGKLTMTDKAGGNRHTHNVPATAKITCDGKDCKLDDLREGFWVKVSTKNDVNRTVTKVEAKTKGDKDR